MRYHSGGLRRWISQGLLAVTAVTGWGNVPVLTNTCKLQKQSSLVYSSTARFLSLHATGTNQNKEEKKEEAPYIFNGMVTILEEGEHHVVVSKPPGVVCHHSEWSGSRNKKTEPEVPMLQRTREAVGERVNLVHRLDRGASGCLLLTKSASDEDGLSATSVLQDAMTRATKTYIALVRGEGIFKGRDFRNEGWFEIDRPIKDENGNLNDATTYFRFLAGQHNDSGRLDRPRASLVLARPKSGRWHQIRRHLNGLGHPIIGDSTHGDSRTNREWRAKLGLLPERTCLHLLKLELPQTDICKSGLSVVSPLESDMLDMLQEHLPTMLEEAQIGLDEEGLALTSSEQVGSQVAIQLEV